MKVIRKILLVLFLSTLFISCSRDDSSSAPNSDCQTDQSKRRGARCKDGTSSNATGSGACSRHGGVDYWLCK